MALTLLGGLLAMAAYAVFPAWETPRLRHRLADCLAANGAFATAVFDVYAHSADHRPRQVRDALLAARAAADGLGAERGAGAPGTGAPPRTVAARGTSGAVHDRVQPR